MFGPKKPDAYHDDAADCPQWQAPCRKHRCRWYVNVRGQHPQTGEIIDQWGCTVEFWPMLMVENSQQQRQTGAAVESFRNEMVKINNMVPRISVEPMPPPPRLVNGGED